MKWHNYLLIGFGSIGVITSIILMILLGTTSNDVSLPIQDQLEAQVMSLSTSLESAAVTIEGIERATSSANEGLETTFGIVYDTSTLMRSIGRGIDITIPYIEYRPFGGVSDMFYDYSAQTSDLAMSISNTYEHLDTTTTNLAQLESDIRESSMIARNISTTIGNAQTITYVQNIKLGGYIILTYSILLHAMFIVIGFTMNTKSKIKTKKTRK